MILRSKVQFLVKFSLYLLFNVMALKRAFPQGLATKIEWLDISIFSDPSLIREKFGDGDAGFLLEVALNYSRFNNADVRNGILAYWTPGFSIIEVPLIWIEKLFDIPLYISLFTINLVIWNLVIFFGFKICRNIPTLLIYSLVFVSFIFSFDFLWIFRYGIFFTEGPAYGILMISLFIATFAIVNNSKNLTFATLGSLFGISLLIRHINEIGIYIGIVLIFSLSLVFKLLKYKKENYRFMGIFIYFVAAFAITMPWRIINKFIYDMPTWMLSDVKKGLWTGIWETDESFIGQYWGSTGYNWACRLDEAKCKVINSTDLYSHDNFYLIKSMISTIFNSPIDYLRIRLTYAEQFYFYITSSTISFLNIFPYIGLIGLLIIIGLTIKIRSINKWPLVVLWSPFILLNLISYSIFHFENRYFTIYRLIVFGLLISLLSIMGSEKLKNVKDQSGKN